MQEINNLLIEGALILASGLGQASVELAIESQSELSRILTAYRIGGLLPVLVVENLLMTLGAAPYPDRSSLALAIDDHGLDDLLGSELTLAAVRTELHLECSFLSGRLREL